MQDKIRTALIGFGVSGQAFHAPFLHQLPQFDLKLVVERYQTNSKKCYPYVTVRRDAQEAFADPDIDLVIITTPNESHFPLAQSALQAGKHVVVEKPFSIRSSEAASLIELAGSKGLMVIPYQNRRYTSDFRTIRRILEQGMLGEVASADIYYDRYRPEPRPGAWREQPKPGSGILYDLGAHLLDQALVLFGAPRYISAMERIQRPNVQATDYFDIQLDYGWLLLRLKASMLVREPGPRYQIHGMKGSFVKYGDDPQEALLRQGILPYGPGWGQEDPGIYGLLHTDFQGRTIREPYPSLAGDYGMFYRQVWAHLIQGKPLEVRPEDGYNVVRLIELAMQSSREARTLACEGLRMPSDKGQASLGPARF